MPIDVKKIISAEADNLQKDALLENEEEQTPPAEGEGEAGAAGAENAEGTPPGENNEAAGTEEEVQADPEDLAAMVAFSAGLGAMEFGQQLRKMKNKSK